jgi:hypothetical protein
MAEPVTAADRGSILVCRGFNASAATPAAELRRSAKNFAHDCLPFLKKVFYGEIPNLISKRSDGRTR